MGNHKTEEKKRQEDIEFLERLNVMDVVELSIIKNNHQGKKTPLWKKVAIDRAIKRKS